MKVEFSDEELPILARRLGLPDDVIREQVEDALLVHLTDEQVAPRREAVRHGNQLVAGHRRSDDCEQAIQAAIADDKITAARADHYRLRWERDPTGTAALLARLAPVAGLTTRAAARAVAGPAYPPEWLSLPERPQPTGRRRPSRVTTEE
jgi:hypothetical protein